MQPTADQLYRQAQWEMKGIRQATELYREAAASLKPSELPSGQWLLRQIVGPLAKEIEEEQDRLAGSAGGRGGERLETRTALIQLLSAEKLAVITAIVGFNAVLGAANNKFTPLANMIAATVRDELEYQKWQAAQKAGGETSFGSLLKRFQARYPLVTRKTWAKWRAKIDLVRGANWSEAERVSFGSSLLGMLCHSAPEHFSMLTERDGGRTTRRLMLCATTSERLNDIETRREVARPLRMPMTMAPIPWMYGDNPELPLGSGPLEKLTGGWVIHKTQPVRSEMNAHTTALPGRYISQADLDALNTIQETPWRINSWILDVMGSAWAAGLKLGGLEVGEALPIPDRMADDTWLGLTDIEKKAHKSRLRTLHSENASTIGKSQAVLDFLSVATELRDEPAIWYPHRKDFRHRIYPDTSRGPTPQGNDLSKALLMFSEGKPLGADGYGWLCIRAANCFGFDKATLTERIQWTLEKISLIEEQVAAPLVSTWWTQAAEPWSFLATCNEITLALSSSTDLTTFVSHLPIPLDGSCNGLQHLAAMGLDPIGAKATNLTADPVRQDVYQEVADNVIALIAADPVSAVPPGLPPITRKMVKQPVMTTPYGVTGRGIRNQLLNGKTVPMLSGAGAVGDYLRDKIVQAVGETVSSARAIMGWLQETASELATAGIPFEWTTPSGSRVRQAYLESNMKKVQTMVGEVYLQVENPTGSLDRQKQIRGSAPNFIHSFDAAHLALTVNEAKHMGITDFAMIHDSFGTHACNTTLLGVVLRRKFVYIYRTDWLKVVANEIQIALPPTPVRGTFDIEEVEHSEYFFS